MGPKTKPSVNLAEVLGLRAESLPSSPQRVWRKVRPKIGEMQRKMERVEIFSSRSGGGAVCTMSDAWAERQTRKSG